MEECKFHAYKFEFVCDYCGLVSSFGIVGFGGKYSNICDLCLVNELSDYFLNTDKHDGVDNTASTSNFSDKENDKKSELS
ncbi:MAG: hypothetical protein NZ551_11450 [Microscillaceae bacterium]|nr:hypothetical protein [Microscillaceae bacterium]MDW8461809.1 hypothetical protein [Cytophagales bacterium]